MPPEGGRWAAHDDRIPDIRRRLDLAAEVERRTGAAGRASGGTISFRCPHPSHTDSNPSFTVRDGRARCWSACAWSGDIVELYVWLDGITRAEAIERLARQAGLDRPGRPAAPPEPLIRHAQHDRLVRWCAGRGWGSWVVDELDLSVVTDRFGQQRIRFPFRCGGGVPYHQDRLLAGSSRYKYLSPSGATPVPYEADRMVLARERGHVFLVEGVTDVVALVDVYRSPAVVGIPGAAAWRSGWAEAFTGLEVYVVGDNDDAGRRFRQCVHRDLVGVAREVWDVMVPDSANDVASWRAGLGPEEFDRQLMAAAEAAAGHGVRIA